MAKKSNEDELKRENGCLYNTVIEQYKKIMNLEKRLAYFLNKPCTKTCPKCNTVIKLI